MKRLCFGFWAILLCVCMVSGVAMATDNEVFDGAISGSKEVSYDGQVVAPTSDGGFVIGGVAKRCGLYRHYYYSGTLVIYELQGYAEFESCIKDPSASMLEFSYSWSSLLYMAKIDNNGDIVWLSERPSTSPSSIDANAVAMTESSDGYSMLFNDGAIYDYTGGEDGRWSQRAIEVQEDDLDGEDYYYASDGTIVVARNETYYYILPNGSRGSYGTEQSAYMTSPILTYDGMFIGAGYGDNNLGIISVSSDFSDAEVVYSSDDFSEYLPISVDNNGDMLLLASGDDSYYLVSIDKNGSEIKREQVDFDEVYGKGFREGFWAVDENGVIRKYDRMLNETIIDLGDTTGIFWGYITLSDGSIVLIENSMTPNTMPDSYEIYIYTSNRYISYKIPTQGEQEGETPSGADKPVNPSTLDNVWSYGMFGAVISAVFGIIIRKTMRR